MPPRCRHGCNCTAVRLLVLLLTTLAAKDGVLLEHGVMAFCAKIPQSFMGSPTPLSANTRLFSSSSNKAHNKQAALRQKLEEAKRQSAAAAATAGTNDSRPDKSTSNNETADEIRYRNDRLRFEELLRNGAVRSDDSNDGYLSRQQEEEEIDAARAGKDRLFEGDPAPTDCFDDLVSIDSEENTNGSSSKQQQQHRLVPWLRKSSSAARRQDNDYLVILTDPRPQSSELRDTIKSLDALLPTDIKRRLIVINADSPAENRRWLRKNGLLDDNTNTASSVSSSPVRVPRFDLYADEKMEWMRSYTALGEKRWSMTLFIIGNGKIRKLARDVDRYSASRTMIQAVQSMLDETCI